MTKPLRRFIGKGLILTASVGGMVLACSGSSPDNGSMDASQPSHEYSDAGVDAGQADSDASFDAGQATSNVVNGSLGGSELAIKDSITAQVSSSDVFRGPATYVQLSTFELACSISPNGLSNGRRLLFALGSTDAHGSSSPAAVTGTYHVVRDTPANSSLAAEVFFEVNGPDCGKISGADASSGSVVVTRPDEGNGIAGTFNLTFDNGDHVTGSFNASRCPPFDPYHTPEACQ